MLPEPLFLAQSVAALRSVLPEVADFEDLNTQLLERCGADDQRRIGGRSDDRTIGERHAVEQERLLALPDTRFENTKVVGVRISPLPHIELAPSFLGGSSFSTLN